MISLKRELLSEIQNNMFYQINELKVANIRNYVHSI